MTSLTKLDNVVESSSRKFDSITNRVTNVIGELCLMESEMSSINDRMRLLMERNDRIKSELQKIVHDINIKTTMRDVATQNEIKLFNNVGVNCDITVEKKKLHQSANKLSGYVKNEEIKKSFEEKKTHEMKAVKKLPEEIDRKKILDEENEIMKRQSEENKENDVIVDNTVKTSIHHPPGKEPTVIDNQHKSIDSNEEMEFSRSDMLFYLEIYKMNFLKFVQCNKSSISSTSGGSRFHELLRSLSSADPTDTTVINNKNDDKQSDSKERKHRKHKSSSKISDRKPSDCIQETNESKDLTIRSSLYDDLDFEKPIETTVSLHKREPEIINRDDMSKAGGEKRLNRLSNLSKMNLLKNRTLTAPAAAKKRKHPESWKNEISLLESKHESTYHQQSTANEQRQLPSIKDEKQSSNNNDNHDTLYNIRMRGRQQLKSAAENKEKDKDKDKQPVEVTTAAATGTSSYPKLPTVQYDLSHPDHLSFEVNSKISKTNEKEKSKPKSKEPIRRLSPSLTIKDSKRKIVTDKSMIDDQFEEQQSRYKHKRRNSSTKKKSKRSNKDLEDGEIV